MTVAFPTEETIAAIATAIAAGQGGIAVIRISGPAALTVGRSVVSIPGGKAWESHKVLYGHVIDKANNKDMTFSSITFSESAHHNRFSLLTRFELYKIIFTVSTTSNILITPS